MKRYNRCDYHFVIVGIVIPILMFFISMNATFAYFTATSTQDSKGTSLGALKIRFLEYSVTASSNVITSSSTLYPGHNFEINATVVNGSNQTVFSLINFKLYVTKDSYNQELLMDGFYTFNASSLIQVTKQLDNSYDYVAFEIESNEQIDFIIPYTFDFNAYGNEYQNATLTYKLQACAIQTQNLTSQQATQILIQRFSED